MDIPANYRKVKILNICTFGIFTPYMFAFKRKVGRNSLFLFLNIVAILLLGADSSNNSTTASSSVGFGLWMLLLILAFRLKPQTTDSAIEAVSEKKESHLPGPVALVSRTGERDPKSNLFLRIGSFLDYIFNDYWKIKKLTKQVKAKEIYVNEVNEVLESFTNFVKNFQIKVSDGKNEIELFEVGNCVLVEPRKGARVTERTSSSSGRGYAGVRVGRVYVGGSSGSTSTSHSVSYPAPDVLTEIDRGQFKITSHRVSFAGSMFTKNAEYKKMIDFNSDRNSILIAPRTGSKVWIIKFPSFDYAWAADAIMAVIFDSESKVLDSANYQGISKSEMIQSNFRSKLFQLDELRKSELDNLRSLVSDLGRLKSAHNINH